MMKVLLDMNEVFYVAIVTCQVKDKACGLIIGLLGMNKVMGLHIYIALVDLDWDCE